MIRMKHVSLLSFLAGASCKLYDDLNDNPLFKHWANPYVNEFIKGILCVLLIMISEASLYLIVIVLLVNGLQMYYDSVAFTAYPFEFSGMLVLFTYFIYKIFTSPVKYLLDYRFLIFCSGILIISIATDGGLPALVLGYKEVEFSYTKLIVRGTTVIACLLLLFINTKINIAPSYLTTIIYFMMGYHGVSCIFQSISLYITAHEKYPNPTIEVSETQNEL